MDRVDLERYRIIGNYLRFDDATRNNLKDFNLKITSSLSREEQGRESFLIWGSPGSGKSFFVHEIASKSGMGMEYREMNLANLSLDEFKKALREVEDSSMPTLCFIDEVDSKPTESWPYEELIPFLEPSKKSTHRICYVLAGSGGESLEEFRERISARPKGKDLLSRIFSRNQCVIPSLNAGDKLIVAMLQLLEATSQRNLKINEIEKIGLYYIAVSPAFSSPRQLRSLALSSAERIPIREDRIKYDYLFSPGDAESKEFWIQTRQSKPDLVEKYVGLEIRNGLSKTGKPEKRGKRIAALPFASISPDPEDEYFSDGLTEEIIDTLCQVEGLEVIARTSVMNYKKKDRTVSQIAEELHVDFVLEGSVRKAGNKIRVTAQLIDGSTESHLWSQKYDSNLEDIFEVQSSVADSVADSLRLKLTDAGKEKTAQTVNPEAYTLYLRGRELLHKFPSEEYKEARQLFEMSIAKDPTFVEPYVDLALLLWYLAGDEDFDENMREAEKLSLKAKEVDPRSAGAKVSMGIVYRALDRPGNGAKEFEEALKLNPNHTEALNLLGQHYVTRGKFEKGISLIRKALSLDPLSFELGAVLVTSLRVSGKVDEALAYLERMKSWYPHKGELLLLEASCYMQTLDFEKAAGTLNEAEGSETSEYSLKVLRGALFAMTGHRSDAERVLSSFSGDSAVKLLNAAVAIRSSLGDLDEAFDSLFKLAEMHTWNSFTNVDPLYGNLHKDPRFKEFLLRVGLA